MNKSREFKRLKLALDKEYRVKEYEQKLDSLKHFLNVDESKGSLDRGDLAKLATQALDNVPDDFSVIDVEKAILKLNPDFDKPRAAISTVLKRLEGKRLTRTTGGKGPRPSIYRIIKKKADG